MAELSFSGARILVVGGAIWLLDQLTKAWVVWALPFETQRPVIRGFLSLVHWGNTGSAWSLFHGNNGLLATVAVAARVSVSSASSDSSVRKFCRT